MKMFPVNTGQTGNKCTIKLHLTYFSGGPINKEKSMFFFTCYFASVNFCSVTVDNFEVMKLWPVLLEQRINLA